jgi:transcriptional regulator with XRE-family HTH domain
MTEHIRKVRLTNNPLSMLGQQAGYPTSTERAAAIGGITRSYLLRVERGAQMPSQAIIDRMAKAYDKSPETIYRAAVQGCKSLARRVLEQFE